KKLFTDNNCGSCHQISSGFSSSYGSTKFANIGLDLIDNDPGINGLYKIPRLKNIALTAPYMHDGRFKTLNEVLEHYSHNIENNSKLSFQLKENGRDPRRMEFTEAEKADLIAFLNTLTDKDLISNPKYSSPFIN
ncbi:MAG: c-type cytochrome, partial [Chitinophagaceae bacterium]